MYSRTIRTINQIFNSQLVNLVFRPDIMRIKRFSLLLVTILFPAIVYSQNKTVVNKTDFYPFSVWYSGGTARATMLPSITPNSATEWKHDLQEIKTLGFNSVKTWVEWAHCEPREGEFHFENLKLLFDLAKEVGLKVVIQVYAESAPEWVGKKFPDGLFEAQNGYKIRSQVDPGYCVDDQGVRDAMIKFYEEAAKIVVQYPNFYCWDVWSEPHIIQWGRPGWIPDDSYCFCPSSQERFRLWLKKKYGTLEKLNSSWYRTFVNWEDVEAPVFGTILTYTDFMDWREFNAIKMAEDLRMRYDAVRKIDKTHVISSHASPVSLFSSPVGSAENDFLMSEQVDFYGLSQYPKHNLPGDWRPWSYMISSDFSYSANKKNGGYYVGEFQAGYGTVGLNVGDPVTQDDQRIWAWSSLATGAKGIFVYAYYPMTSGYESGGYGLINLDGTVTNRAVELGKIAHFIDENTALFVQSKPVKPEIALVYNPLSQMVGKSTWDGSEQSGRDGHINSLIGYYRFFESQNIPVDFIFLNDLEKSDMSKYKLVILPYSLMFKQEAADGLKAYVNQGGHILAEARLAWNDASGFTSKVIPGMGLSDVFGVKEGKVQTIKEKGITIKVGDNSNLPMAQLQKGDIIRGSYFAESVELLKNSNAKVLAYLEDGTPCIVTSQFGKGQAMYVGSFLYLEDARGTLRDQTTESSYVKDSINRNTNKFLLGVVKWANINPPVTSSISGKSSNPIILRLQENPDGYLLYVLNQGTTVQKKFDIIINVEKNGEYLLQEVITKKNLSVKANANSMQFTTDDIPGKDVEIWSIKRGKD